MIKHCLVITCTLVRKMLLRVKSPGRSGTNIYSCSKVTLLSFICAERPWDCLTCDQSQERDIKWVSQWLSPALWGTESVTGPILSTTVPAQPPTWEHRSQSQARVNIAASSLSEFQESHWDLIEWYRGEWITEYFTQEKVFQFNPPASFKNSSHYCFVITK